MSGGSTGIVHDEDDFHSLINEEGDPQSAHFHGDDEEEKDPGIRGDVVEGGEDAEDSGRGSDHSGIGPVDLEDAGNKKEEGKKEGACQSAQEVKYEKGAAAHPSLDMRTEEENPDAV